MEGRKVGRRDLCEGGGRKEGRTWEKEGRKEGRTWEKEGRKTAGMRSQQPDQGVEQQVQSLAPFQASEKHQFCGGRERALPGLLLRN